MSKYELSKDSRVRLDTMVRTNDGFEIADVDLRLRGPGDLAGTQQSGITDLKLADIGKDSEILVQARTSAQSILEADPHLNNPDNKPIADHLARLRKNEMNWSRIS
jgi:ATP-dependent DNA helicase RecG